MKPRQRQKRLLGAGTSSSPNIIRSWMLLVSLWMPLVLLLLLIQPVSCFLTPPTTTTPTTRHGGGGGLSPGFAHWDSSMALYAAAPPPSVPGADIEQPTDEEEQEEVVLVASQAAAAAAGGGDIPLQVPVLRGKVNEIDFCIAPADVSLSRAYGSTSSTTPETTNSNPQQQQQQPILSLTRALNNASNRAVRRILLARSWPSAEALNLSLRQVAAAEKQRQAAAAAAAAQQQQNEDSSSSTAKCPVPRPILNVLTRKRSGKNRKTKDSDDGDESSSSSDTSTTPAAAVAPPRPRSSSNSGSSSAPAAAAGAAGGGGRTDQEYVADQLTNFRSRYGHLPAYDLAEDYLKAILSLATVGVESPTVPAVLTAGVYDESYKRVLAVLKTCGVVLEETEAETEKDDDTTRKTRKQQQRPRRIASQLNDRDFCLSVLDKIQIRKEQQQQQQTAAAAAKEKKKADKQPTTNPKSPEESITAATDAANANTTTTTTITKEDLGGVLLSATLPTMTRQLNALANICERALLFGGDQELLVLAETLDADRNAFIERWYPTTTNNNKKKNKSNEDEADETAAITNTLAAAADETRPGVQFLNAMIQLLRNCHDQGIVYSLDPPFDNLIPSYANAYERLVASAVELGSGYLKPILLMGGAAGSSDADETATAAANGNANINNNNLAVVPALSSFPKPRTAQEELGRFAVWESNFRQQQQGVIGSSSSSDGRRKWDAQSTYPTDLVGRWQVRDEIGGETIGSSQVQFLEAGKLQVLSGQDDETFSFLEGLRWRLDPGPTHLDTCTFQVLNSMDGTVLQYRGFIDRGARLEARFSKRPLQIRGSVMFQNMRNGGVDYYRDMLPINYRTGTTKFVMTKSEK